MRCWRIIVLAILFSGHAALSAVVTTRQINPSVDHSHCTTRQFQHMTFYQKGVWFVFYSDGKNFRYQTSDDSGQTWHLAERPVDQAPNGSTSFDILKVSDSVYISHVVYPMGRYDVKAPYARDPKRRAEYIHEGRIKKGRIEGRQINWLADVNPGFSPDYSNIVQDTDGHFWIFARESKLGVAYRSRNPNGIEFWEPKTVCMPVEGRHAMDAAALDEKRLYVVSTLTDGGRLYGNLCDGHTWNSEPVLICGEATKVPGDDRRASIEFDPTQKRLHLVYVDGRSKLRYRCLICPYRSENWQPQLSTDGLELAEHVFTSALSV
ncbi:MAG: exo-alpha-sialidase, partial [Phycisphaerales bacterium]